MTTEQRSEIRQLINEAILRCEQELDQLSETTKTPAQDCSLETLTRLEAQSRREMDLTLAQTIQKRLQSLLTAKENTHKEDFGCCEECGESIPFERLKILPESTVCVPCLNSKSS